MKTLFQIIILFYLLFTGNFALCGQLPDIPTAVETRLYQGTREEINSFIDSRLAQEAAMARDLEEIRAHSDNDEEKNRIENILESLHVVSSQNKRLKTLESENNALRIKAPALGAPPYSIQKYDEILAILRAVDQQTAEEQRKARLTDEKISILSKEIKIAFGDYVQKKSADDTLGAYETITNLLSMQVDYAIQLKGKDSLQTTLNSLNSLAKEADSQVKKIFTDLLISDDELKKIEQNYENTIEQVEQGRNEANRQIKEANRNTVKYQSQLSDLLLQNHASGAADQLTGRLFENEKNRLELIIEAFQLKEKYFMQVIAGLQLKRFESIFTYDWSRTYLKHSGAKSYNQLLSEWQNNLNEITRTRESIQQVISEAEKERNQLTKKLAVLLKEKDNVSDPRLMENISTLLRQAVKTDEQIDSLSLKASQNINYAISLFEEIQWTLDLLQQKAGWYQTILFLKNISLAKTFKAIQAVVYYPFFSAGGITITLVNIFKLLVFLIGGIFLLRILRKKSMTILFHQTKLSYGAVNSITTLGYYALLILIIMTALSTAGVDLSQLSIVLGALSVGIGFGLQTIANNFISGLILLTDQSIKVGDFVELGEDLTGEVKKVTIRATIIRTYDGEDIIVPNSEFVAGRVNTWTFEDDWRRLKIPFGVSYGTDPDKVVRIALETAREVDVTIEDDNHPVIIRFEGFGESSLDFSIRAWCRMTKLRAYSGMISDYYFVLFRKLKDAGIEIPFPQRDIHLRSMDKQVSDLLQRETNREV